jgi:hypothetical protein
MAVDAGTESKESVDDGRLTRDANRREISEPERDARLGELVSERDALRARLVEAEQQLAELPALRAAREELDALRSSGSWRATAPLRRVADVTRREAIPAARASVKRALQRLAARAGSDR